MWLKTFVLLRFPVALIALLGFSSAGWPWITIAGYVFLAYASIQLLRARPAALKLAGWLVALETVGAVAFLLAVDIRIGQVDPLGAVIIGLASVTVWTLPNSLCLYLLRSKFVVVPETRKLQPIEDRTTAGLKK